MKMFIKFIMIIEISVLMDISGEKVTPTVFTWNVFQVMVHFINLKSKTLNQSPNLKFLEELGDTLCQSSAA